jgi:hypothetical protein
VLARQRGPIPEALSVYEFTNLVHKSPEHLWTVRDEYRVLNGIHSPTDIWIPFSEGATTCGSLEQPLQA